MPLGRHLRPAGFTAVELLVVVIVIGILAAIAGPNYMEMMERMRLRAAAEALYSELYRARSEALKTKKDIFVTFCPGAADSWWFGIDDAVCDCGSVGACERVTDGGDFYNISMPASEMTFTGTPKRTAFEGLRGTVPSVGWNGCAELHSPSGHLKTIKVSILGRIKTLDGHYWLNGVDPCS